MWLIWKPFKKRTNGSVDIIVDDDDLASSIEDVLRLELVELAQPQLLQGEAVDETHLGLGLVVGRRRQLMKSVARTCRSSP